VADSTDCIRVHVPTGDEKKAGLVFFLFTYIAAMIQKVSCVWIYLKHLLLMITFI